MRSHAESAGWRGTVISPSTLQPRLRGIKVAVADAPAEIRAMADVTVSACLRGGVGEVLDRFDEIVGNYEQISFDAL